MVRSEKKPPYPKIFVTDQTDIDFLFDEITIYVGGDGFTYVSFDTFCEKLNFNRDEQLQQIHQHPTLLMGMRYLLKIDRDHQGYKENIILFLRVGHFSLWLAMLPVEDRIKSKFQRELKAYQGEVIQVLEEAFHEGRLSSAPNITRLIEENHEIIQSYKSTIQLLVKLRSRILKRLR